LQFDAAPYDLNEDSDTFSRDRVTATITAGWARRLSDVAHIEIGTCQTRLPEHGPHDWIGVGDVSLIFKDGERVNLPSTNEQ